MRNYKIDNFKAILIFLVVLAHFFELFSGNLKYKLYLIIYMFHMPAFVFTTGYFAKADIKNILFKQLFPYIIFQVLYCLLFGNTVQFSTPFWIMWYLLACTGWTLNLYIVKSKYPVWIALSVIIAVAVGFFGQIGYWFSFSRMLCFYPFFLLGVWFKKSNLTVKTDKYKFAGVLSLAIVVVIAFAIMPHIHTSWLYHAVGYSVNQSSPAWRLALMILGFAFTISLFLIIPNKNVKGITYLGKYTLSIYLIHGFIVKAFSVYYNPFVFTEQTNIMISVMLSIMVAYVFGNRFVLNALKPFTDFGFICNKCRKIFTK